MSIAWRLAQSGRQVIVFDKGAVGAEASWAGAGMLSLGGEIEGPSPLSTLGIESRQLYRGFIRELEHASGRAIDYQECGALDLAYSREEFETLETRAAAQSVLGILSKPLAPKYISTFWPRVRRDDLVGARFYPDDALVNPREVVAALEVACRGAGVSIVPHCPVLRIEVSGRTATVFCREGVRTCQAAVVAAGAWSDSVEIEGVVSVPPSEPVKGHLIAYQQPEQTCHTIVRHGHAYLLQRANGLMIAGASVERVGFDRNILPGIVADLARQASYVFPHLLETTPSEVWIGFRPASNGLQIGAWHSPTLYLAYGHYRNGILLAPATAEHLTAEINANLRTR
jgi:glycine oxidase